jgi:hypothetical protein
MIRWIMRVVFGRDESVARKWFMEEGERLAMEGLDIARQDGLPLAHQMEMEKAVKALRAIVQDQAERLSLRCIWRHGKRED